MPYTVVFIGLANFTKSKSGGMRVLLPDGRNYKQIAPHCASISVAPDTVRGTKGWRDGEIDSDKYQTEFWFCPSKIYFEAGDEKGIIRSAKMVPFLPSLKALAPNIRIDPERANAIADITFLQGTFQAWRFPGTRDGHGALIGELLVPHEGIINIKVTPKNRSDGPTRTIRLEPGTEIAMINTSRGEHASQVPGMDHFRIYEQLSYVPVKLKSPKIPKGIPMCSSQHPAFAAAKPAHILPTCSPTV